MATEKNSSLQLLLLAGILFLAPAIGALVGFLSPHKTHQKVNAIMHSVFASRAKTLQNSGLSNQQGDYLTITTESGQKLCADGQQHEIPCWRLQLERGLLSDARTGYSPTGPDQLYGIIKERTGPNGTIMTLTKKNDLLEEQNKPSGHSTGSRIASAQKALTN